MNLINKAFIRLSLLPAPFYRKIGINTGQLKSILSIKLAMDDRRPNTIQQTRRRKSEKQVSLATVGTMLVSAVLGFMFSLSFVIGQNAVTKLTFYFSMFFFMLSATLISDFTSILIDVRDNYIILPKPVSDRTFVTARLLHIFIHICKVVVPMSLVGIFIVAYKYGISGAILMILMIIMITLFAIFFINAVYIIILKITTPQKFKAIISYVQVVFAVMIYASYQIFPRMISTLHMDELDLTAKTGIAFYPIYWFATAWNTLYNLSGTTFTLLLTALSFILPIVSMYIVVKYLAPSFNNRLSLMNSAPAPSSTDNVIRTQITKKKFTYSEFLCRLLTRSRAEKMGFLFTWKMTARSRDFRIKVYPSIGYLLVYVVIMFMNGQKHILQDISEQGSMGKLLIISALYLTSLLLMMALNQVPFSDQYKASWIYYVRPVKQPGEVILGAAKAAIFKFYIPIVVFITITGLLLVGPSILPNILLGLFNELLIASLVLYIGYKYLPFSLHQNNSNRSGAFIRNIGIMLISGMIGSGHYIIYDMLPAVLLCSVLSIIATWLLMDAVKRTSWESRNFVALRE